MPPRPKLQAVRASERKRPVVKYYPSSDSEPEESDPAEEPAIKSEDEEDEDYASRKKVKMTPAVLPARPPPVPPKPQIFPFLSLPPELRNRIYQLTLTDPAGIDLISTTKAYRRTVMRSTIQRDKRGNGIQRRRGGGFSRFGYYYRPPQPAAVTPVVHSRITNKALALNKAIYAEAQPILYGGNIFSTETTMALYDFLATIGSTNCASVLELEICSWGWSKSLKGFNHPAFTLLQHATNLRLLRVSCQIREDGAGPEDTARTVSDCSSSHRNVMHFLRRSIYGYRNSELVRLILFLVV